MRTGPGGRHGSPGHVVYTADNRPVWASNTQGSPGDNTNITRFGQVRVGYNALTDYCVQAGLARLPGGEGRAG
ncbi:hypothetical protein [Streptomyces sp. NPDC013455]|uniref:hypothetical protein n=1 Tax=Streptomyces sp. NPDC013455 TaxID=3155605 RepID=UPI0033D41AFB